MKQVGNWFKPQYILILAIIVGIIYILKLFKGNTGNTNLDNNLQVNKNKTSKSLPELALIADIQEAAMSEMGTDFKTIKESLTGLNQQDLKEVLNSFGKRSYITNFGIKGGEFFGQKLSLPQWYINELSKSELAEIKNLFKKQAIIF